MSCLSIIRMPAVHVFPVIGACIFILLAWLPTAYGQAGDDLTIGRMKIAIWPEYDDPGVLVIYDGRFADASRFPLKTGFFIPKDAVISDACSLSPRGQHFCQLYETVNRGEYDEVTLYLPFPNFYLSFHTYPDSDNTDTRAINYRVRTNHAVETLEMDIQQPLRSTEFNITPASETASEEKGFNHFKYTFGPVASGEDKLFKIVYQKQDQLPSVDIKYSRMSGSKTWGSPYSTQRQARNIIYIIFTTGVAGLLLTGGVFFYRRKRRT